MHLFTALEEDKATLHSSKKQETEIAIYAKIGNPEGLNQAQSSEQHIQIEAEFTTKQRIRVRKTIKTDGNIDIELTIKVRSMEAGIASSMEYNTPVTEDFMEGFKKSAEKMVVKRRYNFFSQSVKLKKINDHGDPEIIEFPNLKYEVDVFQKADGTFSDWCKIDVEINPILDHIKANGLNVGQFKLLVKTSHLPFQPQQPILNAAATPEQDAFLKKLWMTEFNHRLNGTKDKEDTSDTPPAEEPKKEPEKPDDTSDTPPGDKPDA